MMTLFLALCALAATWAAAYCAFVDGALLSIDDDAEPVDPDVRALVTRRERAHRALAFGRIVSQLLAGGGAAAALKASSVPAPRDDSEEREISVEQFRDVVAAEAGVSKDDERLLRGVFSLGDTTAQDIMVPRVDVIGADRAWSWSALVDRVRRAGHARYVVFDGTIDNVVGVLNAKDLLPSVLAGSEPADGWRAMVRPAQFIPATKPVDDQLRDFKASRQHLAVVVDEFGGTAGIVTLEDALEVIVGDIRDEHDVEEAEVRRDATGGLSVSARLPLDDLAELIGEDLSGEDVHTIGGLVYARVGGAPRVGDAVTVGGHRLVIERVHRRRIVRVAVQRVPEPAQGQP